MLEILSRSFVFAKASHMASSLQDSNGSRLNLEQTGVSISTVPVRLEVGTAVTTIETIVPWEYRVLPKMVTICQTMHSLEPVPALGKGEEAGQNDWLR